VRRIGTDKIVRNDFGQPKAGRSPSAWMCESRIQTGLGLFVPCGLRALRALLVLAQLVEPPTRGLSVDSVTDSIFESMS
jgi:hypothetical protein